MFVLVKTMYTMDNGVWKPKVCGLAERSDRPFRALAVVEQVQCFQHLPLSKHKKSTK